MRDDDDAALEGRQRLRQRVDDCMSRWLVGSSSSRTCGFDSEMAVNTTRAFCPPDSLQIGCRWWCPARPNLPSCALACSALQARRARELAQQVLDGRVLHLQGVDKVLRVPARPSAKCDRRCSPVVGSRSPASRFISVVFPAPLGPTTATREPMSMPMLRPESAKSSRPG